MPRARHVFAANLGGSQENVTRHGVQMTGKTAARAVIAGSYSRPQSTRPADLPPAESPVKAKTYNASPLAVWVDKLISDTIKIVV